MKKHKHRLIILGMHYMGSAVEAFKLAELPNGQNTEIVFDNDNTKNILESRSDAEKISIHGMQFDYKPVDTQELQRNKFFDKPRNNFRRR